MRQRVCVDLQWVAGYAMSIALTAMLAACGGGSNSETPAPVARATSSQLQPEASLIPSADVRQLIVDAAPASDGLTHLIVPATAATIGSDKWSTGKIVSLPGGVGTRFPLGLSGRVTSRSVRSDGGLDVVLSPVRLTEAVQSYMQEARSVPLDAGNFIGVLSPSSVRGLQAIQNGKGLLISNAPRTTLNSVLSQRSAVAPTELGTIELSASIDLAELKGTEGQQGPVSAESKVTVSGSFSKLKLVQQMDLDKRSGIPVGLKSMDLRVVGDLSVEAKLEGTFDVTVGTYSNAWKSVEERSLSLLGISGKLSGLEAKDKIGKYPIAGLVFSVPCATTVTCPVATGVTDIPLIEAQTGGVIVWVYLTSNGRLTVEGSVGVKLNQGSLEVGMVKPDAGKLDMVAKLTGSGTSTLIEAPRISGTASLQAKAGAEVEVDLFVGGVWIGNAGVFGGVQYNGKVTTVGALAYGAPQLAGPWQWTGSACVSSTFGTGVQAHGAFAIGASVETSWKDISAALKYEFSLPEAADLTMVGSYTLGGVPIWVVNAGISKCWPEPAVATVSPSTVMIGDSNRFVVTGSNLPPTLQAKFDDGASTCAPPEQITSNGFTVICVAAGSPGPRALAVSVAEVPISNSSVVTFIARPVAPPTIFFTGSAAVLVQGASAVLDWSTLDASTCTASGAWSGTLATAGRQTVSPATPGAYSYSLSCSGPGGLSTGRVNLQVNPAPVAPPVVSLSAAPTQVVQGSASLISWSSTDSTGCTATVSWSGAKATAGSQSVTPAALGLNNYGLSCTGTGGTTTASTAVTVTSTPSVPTVTLVATPSVVTIGGTTTLAWSSSGSTSCTASGTWSGVKAISGTEVVTPGAGTTAFSLTCTGPGGSATASSSVTVAFQENVMLNDTGVSSCYQIGSSSLVACSSPAASALSIQQDGMVGRDVAYPVNSDGAGGFEFARVSRGNGVDYSVQECVIDKITGLTWEGKTNDLSQRDGSKQFSTDAPAYVAYVNSIALCGYSDWRLPRVRELISIAHLGLPLSVAPIDATWFPNTSSLDYLSSDLIGAGVFTVSGAVTSRSSTALARPVRLVRGPAWTVSSSRFSVVGDGSEVQDRTTGLVWKRCPVGFTWNGAGCQGSTSGLTHEQALALPPGTAGWRIPNIKELFSLVDYANGSFAIDPLIFPLTPVSSIWSSTPAVWSSGAQAYRMFNSGDTGTAFRSATYGVYLVRN